MEVFSDIGDAGGTVPPVLLTKRFDPLWSMRFATATLLMIVSLVARLLVIGLTLLVRPTRRLAGYPGRITTTGGSDVGPRLMASPYVHLRRHCAIVFEMVRIRREHVGYISTLPSRFLGESSSSERPRSKV
jgi:hypothetical protein